MTLKKEVEPQNQLPKNLTDISRQADITWGKMDLMDTKVKVK